MSSSETTPVKDYELSRRTGYGRTQKTECETPVLGVSCAEGSLDIGRGWEMSFIEYKRTISTGDYVVAYKVSGDQRKACD